MAGVQGAMEEVILICAVDYLTGETLINKLVRTTKKVTDWRTRYSGVTAQAMANAIARNEALNGWKEARAELWRHIDANTILVGAALQHDLGVLRMIHTRVVDTAILARNAVGMETRGCGLKVLCDSLLGIRVQSNGRRGHDCLEDALAAREVVLWCTQNQLALAEWGKIRREEEELRRKEEREKALERQKEKEKEKERERERERENLENPRPADDHIDTYVNRYSSEDEMLHWSEIAEDLGWPHPDTGYDPWSD
jgi:DNA polymerase III epsilon subunit-like protein